MSRLAARPDRIVVFRALQLGDLLCSMPAFRALRATFPAARIALVGLPTMRGFAARYPHWIDEFIDFPGAPGFPEQDEGAPGLPSFLDAMRARRFDLAIQLHGNGGDGNVLVRAFGATTMAGFHRPQVHDESATGLFVDWDAVPSEVGRYLALMEALGANPAVVGDASIELPIRPAEEAEWIATRRSAGLEGRSIACIHPGARWSSRRWPVDRFAAVADALARQGSRIVLTGSADERAVVDALADRLRGRGVAFVDLCGRTSLGALAALLRETRLLVSNDTGISHVAAAMGTPSVIVASGSDVVRWSPVDRGRHRVLAHDVPCRPCMYRDCPIDHPCAKGVEADLVIAAAATHAFAAPPPTRHAA